MWCSYSPSLFLNKKIPESSELFVSSTLAGIETEGTSGYIDFQFCPLHINICSSSKDNSTHGTNSCKRNEQGKAKKSTAVLSRIVATRHEKGGKKLNCPTQFWTDFSILTQVTANSFTFLLSAYANITLHVQKIWKCKQVSFPCKTTMINHQDLQDIRVFFFSLPTLPQT